jgi:hypothetical protein
MALGSRAFLKKLGFDFTRTGRALDNALLKSLPETSREELEAAWEAIHLYGETTKVLYSIPSNQKQAALLFSHEGMRTVLTLKWVNEVLSALKPETLVEYGCGAGHQLQYIHHCFPEIQLTGLDQFKNLLATITPNSELTTLCTDYYEFSPKQEYNMVMCDFGWDHSDIQASDPPYSKDSCFGYEIYSELVDDFQTFYEKLIGSMKKSVGRERHIIITGRLPQATNRLAFFKALEVLELAPRKDMSRFFKYKTSSNKIDIIHAYVLNSKTTSFATISLEEVLQWD